jgi:hypothetical protein
MAATQASEKAKSGRVFGQHQKMSRVGLYARVYPQESREAEKLTPARSAG